LGATDGHAKNFSIFLQPGDSYVMTPLYDILSKWPYAGDGPRQFRRKKAGLAMAVRPKNAHYAFDEIQTRHWHQLAMANGGADIWVAMQELVERVPGTLDTVQARLPRGFNEQLWNAISQAVTAQVDRFGQGLKQVRAT
jgi:serine/threonine-protein kinase HipA